MSYEPYYSGGWQSGESGATPITPEALNHIEKGIKNSAPAGYGLGEAKSIAQADVDTTVAPGWYRITDGITVQNGVTYSYAYMRVDAYSRVHCVQTLYPTISIGVILRRWRYSNTWSNWEWDNPPMALGVEYRTTERWQGKPVYVKAIDLGTLPAAERKSVEHGIGSAATVIAFDAYATNGTITQMLPVISTTGTPTCKVHVTQESVQVFVIADMSTYTGVAILRYIKG